MILERVRERIAIKVEMGGGYKRNSARVLLAEVGREYGQAGVDTLILELSLDEKLGLPVAQVIVS